MDARAPRCGRSSARPDREVGGRRLETSSNLYGSTTSITGFNLPVYAGNTGGYGFIDFEISNSIISTVFCQPLMDGAPSWEAS